MVYGLGRISVLHRDFIPDDEICGSDEIGEVSPLWDGTVAFVVRVVTYLGCVPRIGTRHQRSETLSRRAILTVGLGYGLVRDRCVLKDQKNVLEPAVVQD